MRSKYSKNIFCFSYRRIFADFFISEHFSGFSFSNKTKKELENIFIHLSCKFSVVSALPENSIEALLKIFNIFAGFITADAIGRNLNV